MSGIAVMEIVFEPLIFGNADEQAWEVSVANGKCVAIGELEEAFLIACSMWLRTHKQHFLHQDLKQKKIKMTMSQRG